MVPRRASIFGATSFNHYYSMNTKQSPLLPDAHRIDKATQLIRACNHRTGKKIIDALLLLGDASCLQLADYLCLKEIYVAEQLNSLVKNELVLAKFTTEGIRFSLDGLKLIRVGASVQRFYKLTEF